MPSPVYSAGAPGNLINGVSVAKGSTIAAFLDLSNIFEGQVTCEMTTGGTAPTAGTTFSVYKVYGNSSANTISSASAAGATSITVSGSAGLHVGQKVALQQASGSKLGELVTISGAITGSGPYTMPVTALVNSYSSGDAVYLVGQTATAVVTPSSPSGTWAASTDYSGAMFLGTGQWAIAGNNGDGTQTVTVTVSVDKITAYQ
jgi:hypothetical protein